MEDWMEIFRAGRHTDSEGRVRDWSTQDLDFAVKSYDPAQHEAPLVIGHPATNGPAYGWVQGLKRVGDLLMAKAHQVAPEFAQLVKDGRFKKRSTSFYPNGTLRHIGFLGAQPPAVKGLRDISLSSDEYCISYEESAAPGPAGDPQPDPHKPEDAMDKEERERLEKKAADAEAARVTAETQYAEAKRKADELQAEKDKAASDHAEAEVKTQHKARKERLEKLVEDGKVLPAESGKLLQFAAAIGTSAGPVDFAEDGTKIKGDAGELEKSFWSFIEKRGTHGLFRSMEMKEEEPSDHADADKAADMITAGRTVAEDRKKAA